MSNQEARIIDLYNDALDLHEDNDLLAAEALLLKAEELDPTDTAILNNLGCLYDELGDYRSAIEYYTAAIALEPDDADFHYNLALSMIEVDSDKKEIVEHLTKAAELDQDTYLDDETVQYWLTPSELKRIGNGKRKGKLPMTKQHLSDAKIGDQVSIPLDSCYCCLDRDDRYNGAYGYSTATLLSRDKKGFLLGWRKDDQCLADAELYLPSGQLVAEVYPGHRVGYRAFSDLPCQIVGSKERTGSGALGVLLGLASVGACLSLAAKNKAAASTNLLPSKASDEGK